MNDNDYEKIFECVTGSHLYGTNIPTSDKDYVGVFIASKEYYLGLKTVEEIDLSIPSKGVDGKNDPDAVDRKLYELKKFTKLAMENNPNIVEILFSPYKNILFCSKVFQRILEKRDLFPWIGAAQKFLGYAYSQKHKLQIKSGNMTDLQIVHDFLEKNLTDFPFKGTELTADIEDQFKKLVPCKIFNQHIKIGDINIQRNQTIKRSFAMIKDRVSKFGNRHELVTKYGYDTKFGMHLIRLMLEGKELLETGKIQFPLKQKDFLIDIRNGKYTCSEVIQISEDLESELENLKLTSELPKKPRFKEINELLINILSDNVL